MNDNKDILVSVIVPVYNAKNYLEACLDSIINQSYKNIEIILIDDGSNDGSSDIVDLYAEKDNRIKVVHNTNHGVSYSRNCGIKMATGGKILFIDSDDTVNLDYVNKLVEPLKKEDADVVICGINDVNVRKNIVRARKFPETLTGDLKEDFCALFMMPIITGPVTKLYDVNILRKYKVYFSEDVSFNEDVIFNIDYFKYVKRYKVVKESLYDYYRRSSGTASSIINEKSFECAMLVLSALKEFVLNNNITYGRVALTHQGINYLRRFSKASCYADFKVRVKRINDILFGLYETKGSRRAINVWLLKKNMTLVLYLMYWFREKFKL